MHFFTVCVVFFFFKQKTAYEIGVRLVGSEMCIRDRPKWVNRVGNQEFLPTQITPVENLVLAGAHTRTEVDVWSIEAAVESGRRAAQVFEPSVKVLGQYRPWWLLLLRSLDNVLYRLNAPNVLDVTLIAAIVAGVLWLLLSLRQL